MSELKFSSNVEAIKAFFKDSARPLENREMMALTKEERAEVGEMCAKALGGVIVIEDKK